MRTKTAFKVKKKIFFFWKSSFTEGNKTVFLGRWESDFNQTHGGQSDWFDFIDDWTLKLQKTRLERKFKYVWSCVCFLFADTKLYHESWIAEHRWVT